jgi:hypothetical protein
VIDKLLPEHGHRPQDITGKNRLVKQLMKASLELLPSFLPRITCDVPAFLG